MGNWAQATQAAESVIEDNLARVSRVTLWLVGGKVNDGAEIMHIHANIVDEEGETVKLRYEIPTEMHNELDTEKAVMGYAVEVIMNHLVLPQYFEKFD